MATPFDPPMLPSTPLPGAPTFAPSMPAPEPVTAPQGVPTFAAAPVPAPAPTAMPPAPAPVAMPNFGAPPVAPQHKPGFMEAVAPIVMAMAAGRGDPAAVGAGLAAFERGRQLKRAELEDDQTRAERQRQEAAGFYTRAITEANQFDDPVQFQQWKSAITPMAQVYNINPDVFQFSDAKLKQKAKKDAQAVIATLRSVHGSDVDDPTWQASHSTTLNGQTVKVSDVYRMAELPTVTDASGNPVAPTRSNDSAQRVEVNIDGKPAFASYDPKMRKWYDTSGNDVTGRVTPKDTLPKPVPEKPQRVEGLLNGKPAFAFQVGTKFQDSDGNDVTKTFRPLQTPAERQAATTTAPTQTDLESGARAILEHRMSPSQAVSLYGGFGKEGQAFKRALVSRIQQVDPTFNFEKAESDYQFGKSTGTQTTVRYIDNIAKTIPMLRDANNALTRSNVQIVNGAILSTENQIGNINVADFNFKLALLADEIAKTLQGGGTGNATSDAKLRQANALLNGKMSAAQLNTVLDAAQDMLKVRRDSLTSGTYMDSGAQKKRVYYDANGNPISR